MESWRGDLLSKDPPLVLPALFLPLILVASQATAEPRSLGDPGASNATGMPCTISSSRAGIPLVLVSAPGAPWAVVQLHARVAGEGVPAELRAHAEALAAALAEGRTAPSRPGARDRVARAHGETLLALDQDAIVISDGVPAASLDAALVAQSERLVSRRRLLPAGDPTASPVPGEGRIPLVVRQALAPAHPYAHSLTRGDEPPDAASLSALADQVLRRDGIVIVVIGSDPEPRLRTRALTALRAVLPAGAKPPGPLAPVEGARVIADVTLEEGPKGPFAWLYWPTAGLREASPGERATVRTLATLLGAEASLGEAAGWLSWHVPLPSRERAEEEEGARLQRLEAVAAGGVSAEEIAAAATRARSARLLELAAPESLARALGAEALAGKACTLGEELDAYGAVTAEEVRAFARALLEGGRLSLRGEGPPVGEGT